MINQDLVNYIKEQTQKGLTNENIKSLLLAKGWQRQDIESALTVASNPDIPIPSYNAPASSGVSIMPKPTHASFWKRALAFIVDEIIISIAALILSFLFRNFFLNLGENLWYIGFMVLMPYFVILNSSIGKGQTLGKKLLGIRIVNTKGQVVTIPRSFLRYFIIGLVIFNSGIAESLYSLPGILQFTSTVFFVLTILLFFGIVGLIIFNEDKRGLHDYLADTIVINSKNSDDVKVPEVRSFKEVFTNHKAAFTIVIVLFILIIAAAAIIPQVLLKTSGGKINFNAMMNLKNDLEKNFPISNVGVQSQWEEYQDWGGSEKRSTRTLTISGYLKYPIYNDENTKNKLYEEINQRVLSTYPGIQDFNNIVVLFRTGYDLGIASFWTSDTKIFPVTAETEKPQSEEKSLSAYQINITSAKSALQMKKYDISLQAAKQALLDAKTNKEKAEAHYWIGLSYYRVDAFKNAETEYNTAISLDPDYAPAFSSLSTINSRYGKTDQAIEFGKKAIALDPNYSWAHSNLGIAYFNVGKLTEAMQEFNTAIAIAPDVPDFHYNIAFVYSSQNNILAAVEHYNKAIDLDPGYEAAYHNLGKLYNDRNETEKAKETYQKGVENLPNSTLLHYELGIDYYKLKNYDLFEKEMKLAIQYDEHYPPAYLALFEYYAVAGRSKDLKALLTQYMNVTGKSKEQVTEEINNTEWIVDKSRVIRILDQI